MEKAVMWSVIGIASAIAFLWLAHDRQKAGTRDYRVVADPTDSSAAQKLVRFVLKFESVFLVFVAGAVFGVSVMQAID